MSIDLSKEPAIPLADVPKLRWLPRRRGGRRLHVSTVFRWCLRGIRGVRLEYVQAGGIRVTTEAALLRFFERLTTSETEPTKSNEGRQRRLDVADQLLDDAGF